MSGSEHIDYQLLIYIQEEDTLKNYLCVKEK